MAIFVLLQAGPIGSLAPASVAEERADLALRRASDGKMLAARFLCRDKSRYRQLLELDRRFNTMQQSFVVRFGHRWMRSDGELTRDERLSADELGRRDDCRLRDSFAAGIADYENGLLAAQVELGFPEPHDG